MSYRQHGVESAVDYDHVRDGASTSLFVAAVESDGRVVGGFRVQGPYTRVDQAYALREWAGREGTTELRRQIGRRLSEGVIEVKAVWVDRDADRHDALTAVLARMFVHAVDADERSVRVLHRGLACGAALGIQRRCGERRGGPGGVPGRAVPDVADVVGPRARRSS